MSQHVVVKSSDVAPHHGQETPLLVLIKVPVCRSVLELEDVPTLPPAPSNPTPYTALHP